jgi:predicted phosphodiesterase
MKIGFIADIHEDINSLKLALKVLEEHVCEKIVCLGDIVGYPVPYYGFLRSRNASEVLKLVKEKCSHVIIGNHDLYAARKLPKFKAGFSYPWNWFRLDYSKRKALAKNKVELYEHDHLSPMLSKKEMKLLGKLPELIIAEFDGIKIMLSHYTYPDLSGSLISESEFEDLTEKHLVFAKKHGCLLSVCGHDHKVMLATPDRFEKLPFGKIKIQKETPTILAIPAVANGTYESGVMVFDTKTHEANIISLNLKTHTAPEWRKL